MREFNLSKLKVGDSVKVNVNDFEKLWFEVTLVNGETLKGKVDEHPLKIENLIFGEELTFNKDNVLDYLEN